ncbi:hypothetical protein MNBD_DELTA04-1225 [hydrothermal vent metagenome]|uniref:Uncharacterized protein n=1 Tax=hydrothermal vent metagenome TaxID=652676 RepID=A0A3B0UTD4_9ZZZZ
MLPATSSQDVTDLGFKPETKLGWRGLGLLTLVTASVLIIVYVRLTKQEEKFVRQEFGWVYNDD